MRRIAPKASQSNGRVTIHVALEETDDAPGPIVGMLVGGTFQIGEREALNVPSSAIVMQDGFSYVFALDQAAPDRVRRIRVETGRRQGDRVEIHGDLPANAGVVQAGGPFLSDGATVRIGTADAGDTPARSAGDSQ